MSQLQPPLPPPPAPASSLAMPPAMLMSSSLPAAARSSGATNPSLPPLPPPPVIAISAAPAIVISAVAISPIIDAATQTPFMHCPNEHAVPFAFGVTVPQPLTVEQVAASLHSSPAAHVGGAPPVHTPLTQLSFVVQALPSLHVVPSSGGIEQVPVAWLHVPAPWH